MGLSGQEHQSQADDIIILPSFTYSSIKYG